MSATNESKRVNYQMTEEDKRDMIDACKGMPLMELGGYPVQSPSQRAREAWKLLGEKMGFDYKTVKPRIGKGERFFTAIPLKDKVQRTVGAMFVNDEVRQSRIKEIEREMWHLQAELNQIVG